MIGDCSRCTHSVAYVRHLGAPLPLGEDGGADLAQDVHRTRFARGASVQRFALSRGYRDHVSTDPKFAHGFAGRVHGSAHPAEERHGDRLRDPVLGAVALDAPENRDVWDDGTVAGRQARTIAYVIRKGAV